MSDFVQMRRHLPYDLECRSETMYHYLGKNGGNLVGSMQRIAMLYIATEENAEHRSVVESISATNFEILTKNLKDFQQQVEALKRIARKESKGPLNLPHLQVPDNHKFTIGITHPIFNKLIENLRYFDNGMATLEVLWLMGLLDEDRYKFARMKLASTFSHFSNEVYRITNRLRDMDQGRGSTSRRVNQQIAAQLHQGEDTPAEEAELTGDDVQTILGSSNDSIEQAHQEAEPMQEIA